MSMEPSDATARILPRSRPSVDAVVDVFCDAFFDYPVMRYVLESDARDYAADLDTLIDFFVMARYFRKEILLGVAQGDQLAAAAIVSHPDADPPPEFYEYRQRVWAELGSEAEARYDVFGRACAPFQKPEPHLHLNMIGVRASAQGQGLGRVLLEQVHRLSLEDAESRGVSLTTEVEANVQLYQHFGYHLVGRALVVRGLTTWGFYRPDTSAEETDRLPAQLPNP